MPRNPDKIDYSGGLPSSFQSFAIIENQCHWVLDTAFREDHNQTHAGNAAKNRGTVRRIVFNILKDDPEIIKTIPEKTLRGPDEHRLSRKTPLPSLIALRS